MRHRLLLRWVRLLFCCVWYSFHMSSVDEKIDICGVKWRCRNTRPDHDCRQILIVPEKTWCLEIIEAFDVESCPLKLTILATHLLTNQYECRFVSKFRTKPVAPVPNRVAFRVDNAAESQRLVLDVEDQRGRKGNVILDVVVTHRPSEHDVATLCSLRPYSDIHEFKGYSRKRTAAASGDHVDAESDSKLKLGRRVKLEGKKGRRHRHVDQDPPL